MPKQVFYKISESRREKLIRPAIVEFTRRPFEKITVLSLSERMKILRTDFYYYFQDKEDIFSAVSERIDGIIRSAGQPECPGSALAILFNYLISLKGSKNSQYLLDLADNFTPLALEKIADELIRLYGNDNSECKRIKVQGKIAVFFRVLSEFKKGNLELEDARKLLACEKK